MSIIRSICLGALASLAAVVAANAPAAAQQQKPISSSSWATSAGCSWPATSKVWDSAKRLTLTALPMKLLGSFLLR